VILNLTNSYQDYSLLDIPQDAENVDQFILKSRPFLATSIFMKLPKLNLLKVALTFIVFTLFFNDVSQAQLFPVGNKVGIGIQNPEATLHLKDLSTTLGGGSMTPMLSFQSIDPSYTSIYKWNIQMNLSNNLTFLGATGNNTPTEALTINPDYVKIYSSLKVGNFQQYASGLTPNNTQGYHLSLGLKELGTNGAWQGKGATMFTTSSGEFQLMTNHSTSVINGTSNMLNNVRFTVNDNGITIRKDASKDKVDLSFIDPALTGTDKRAFTIRSVGTNHPSAPNTLEFWDPHNNGNAFFTMPVRIGGGYADLNILSSGYDLYVAGGIRSTRVKVDAYANWPDYVFQENYNLWTLEKTELYINENQHLPGVPSAKQVEEEGIDLAEMNAILLQKIEELTLHLIEVQKQVNSLSQKQ
jgi:hypothetical protein